MKTSPENAAAAAERPDDQRPGANPEPNLAPDVQAQLGELLRGMYSKLLTRPIPDEFADLLNRLDQQPEKNPR